MSDPQSRFSRRELFRASLAAGAVGLSAGTATATSARLFDADTVRNGRLKQSIVHWCYKETWDVPGLAKVAAELGCKSVELVPVEHWPMLKELGLECAIASSHGFTNGPNHRKNWDMCDKVLRERIDQCAEFGFKRVITFTGMADGIDPETGAKNCVEFFKRIVGDAERKNVTLCLEMLNSRVSTHPMKGHPGYQGDHTEYCIDILKAVGSPNLKLLFDIYHVQIMDGDVINRIKEHKDWIGHVHTAGNPGRAELDDTQEIQYRPILNALADTGYDGFIGHEFIPTRDALEGLQEAVALSVV